MDRHTGWPRYFSRFPIQRQRKARQQYFSDEQRQARTNPFFCYRSFWLTCSPDKTRRVIILCAILYWTFGALIYWSVVIVFNRGGSVSSSPSTLSALTFGSSPEVQKKWESTAEVIQNRNWEIYRFFAAFWITSGEAAKKIKSCNT